MNAITLETRKKSYEDIKKKMNVRERQVLEVLGDREMTANEIARELYMSGLTPFFSRNYASPRLNELENWGVVEVVGKRKDFVGKSCAVYKRVKEENRHEDNTTICIQDSLF